ncbi:trypsin-like peptidase domain-containing protein [Dactylosporangium sp. CA-139066]|uniref:trypsin-like peptidase domain-containing protein n=1 Tax=Dactylosporangium sp. CA-139066 TaxID=3239930 RepID=UPI003D8F796E
MVLDTTTARGRDAVTGWKPGQRSAGARQRQRTVKASRATFDRLRADITTLTSAKLPGQEHITAVTPDGANNRLILDVDRLDDGLLDGLAARYGTELIAVRYEQPTDRGRLQARENDTSGGLGFYGGANLQGTNTGSGCTSGFSWYSGTTNYMLTAGHCFHSGGGAWTPAENMGFVTPGSRENWLSGTGTQFFTGQSTYYGDLALVELSNGRHSAGKIYSGGQNSTSSRTVAEMWSRSPARGDQFCSGGRLSGEQCGWVVQQTGFDYRLSTGEWVRTTTAAYKYSGTCSIPGDSGGPVYTIRGDGAVAAKGIWSWGGGGVNGSGTSLIPCSGGFTDIWFAYYGLPGFLRTG